MKGLGTYNEAYERKLGQDLDDSRRNWEYYDMKAKQAKAQYDSKLMEQENYEREIKVVMREL
jgi:hypothetical protein